MSVASSPPAFDFSSRSSDFASVPGTPSTPTTPLVCQYPLPNQRGRFGATADAFYQVSEAEDAPKDREEEEDIHEMELEDEVGESFPCSRRFVCPTAF